MRRGALVLCLGALPLSRLSFTGPSSVSRSRLPRWAEESEALTVGEEKQEDQVRTSCLTDVHLHTSCMEYSNIRKLHCI